MASNRVAIDRRDGRLANTPTAGASWREALIFMLIAGVVGQLVRSPYLGGPLFADDFDFLAGTGLVRNGRTSFLSFIRAPAGPHPMILWRIIYYLQFLAFGASPVLFRVAIGVVQALSGLTLFALLCRYLNHRSSAWFGGLLWGLSAIGGWDHPLSFMLCGFIAWGILWLLLGMFCITRLTARTGPLWPGLLALATTLAMLSWGILVAVLPALPLQYVLLEHRTGLAKRRVIGWALAWLIPMATVGALQIAMILPEAGSAERQRDFSPLDVAMRVCGQLSMVAGNLTYGHTVNPNDEALWPKALLAFTLTGAVGMFVRGRALRFAAALGSATLIYLVLADSGGSEIELADVVTAGRYLYLPTLLGCCLLAALFDSLAAVWPTPLPWRRGGAVLGTLLLAVYAVHQFGVARSARGVFDDMAFSAMERLQAQKQLLLELAHGVRPADTTLRVPDLPVLVSPPSHVLWTVSTFAATLLPGELQGLEIVPADACSSADLQQFATALNQCRSGMVRPWAELLQLAMTDFRAVAWLAEFAARTPRRPLYVPQMYFIHGDISYPADQVERWGLSSRQPALRIASAPATYRERIPETIARLESSAEPAAQAWVAALRQIASQPAPAR